MENTKIVNRLNEAKSALLELKPYFASNSELLTHKTKDAHLIKNIETVARSLTKNLDRIASLTTTSEFSDQDLEREAKKIVNKIKNVPPSGREPAFKCLASYHACKDESSNKEGRVLCALALTICWAKEVIPLILIPLIPIP